VCANTSTNVHEGAELLGAEYWHVLVFIIRAPSSPRCLSVGRFSVYSL
jgi:hypothetical protein